MKKNNIVLLSLLILLSTISFIHVKPVRSQNTTLFVDPAAIIDQTKQSGSTFTVDINISDVNNLGGYGVCIMWEPSMLEIPSDANITYGDIFADDTLRWTLKNNTEGWVSVSEALIDIYVPGFDGSGRLFSIEFLVQNYGSTELQFDDLEPPIFEGTYLIEQQFPDYPIILFTAVDGYFSNKLPGDADSDRDVDYDDLVILADAYGSSSGQPAYDARADFDGDGDVDLDDFFILAVNYGKSV